MAHLPLLNLLCYSGLILAEHMPMTRSLVTHYPVPTRPYGLPRQQGLSSRQSHRRTMLNVPNWFAFTPLDTLKDAVAARLQAIAYYGRQRTQVWRCHRREAQLEARRRHVFQP